MLASKIVFKIAGLAGLGFQAEAGSSLLSDMMAHYPILGLEPLIGQALSRQQRRANGRHPLERIYTATLAEGASALAVVRRVNQHPGIEYAEPLYRHRLFAEPNDPFFGQQEYFSAIKMAAAWEVVKGSAGEVVIAVVDGGTDIDHPDLNANLWVNTAEIPNNNVDDDGNGFVDDIHGWNFPLQSGDPSGLDMTPISADHGSNTAGIACAVTDNGAGVAGTSWNARLMAINAADAIEDRAVDYGYEGVLYAVENGANVINLSWGREGAPSIFEQEIIAFAHARGCAIIAAAGNDNNDVPNYPAAYPYVLSVAATDLADVKASLSNYGTTVDLAAPGVSILSTLNNGEFGSFPQGTSFSSPMVAGVVALVKTLHPNWLGIQASEQVRVTADNIDEVNSLALAGKLGKGRVNAERALTDFTSPAIRISDLSFSDSGQDGTIHAGDSVEVAVNFINYLAPVPAVEVSLRSRDLFVELHNASGQILNLGTLQQTRHPLTFTFKVRKQAPEGRRLDFFLEMTGNHYEDREYFHLFVEPTFLNLTVNNIQTTLTNVGRIGFANTATQEGGVGFVFKKSENLLFEGAIIAGTGPNQISNSARVVLPAPFDEDFSGVEGENLRIVAPTTVADQESFAVFEDDMADFPLGLRITQKSFAEAEAPNDDFVILLYQIENTSDTTLADFHFGIFFDWDIGEPLRNSAQYVPSHRLGYVHDTATYVGSSLLSDDDISFSILDNSGILNDRFSDEEKWQAISGGVPTTELRERDVAYVMAAGPFSIPPQEFVEIGFALLAGESADDIQKNAEAARQLWQAVLVTAVEPTGTGQRPVAFALHQNFPNPFNPTTEIRYTLEHNGEVELTLYNLRGQKIRTLVHETQRAGFHSIAWDGRDASGTSVASGVYVYRLRSAGSVQSRKLVLVR